MTEGTDCAELTPAKARKTEPGEGTLSSGGQQPGERGGWGSREYRDAVTGVTSRLWTIGPVFPTYKFTSRHIWGRHRKAQGGEDRQPEWHAPVMPENFEAKGKARRAHRSGTERKFRDMAEGGPCESNRRAQVECAKGCKKNRKLAEQGWDDFEVRQSNLGWGLFALQHYEEGEIICEYTGRVLDNGQLEDIMGGKKEGAPLYILSLKGVKGMHVDAEEVGGPGRFANHVCADPTAEYATWWTAGTPRNALVARARIDKGDEITMSYGMDQQGNHKTKCHC